MISHITIYKYDDSYQIRYFKATVSKEIVIQKATEELRTVIESLVDLLEEDLLPEEKIIELTAEVLRVNIQKEEVVNLNIKYKETLLETELTAEQMLELMEIYPEWEPVIDYSAGTIVKYESNLYEVIAPGHTSQADWTPDATPALFRKIVPEGVIPEWIQPTGSHDAYNTGDRVTFNGLMYESLIDGNVWSPEAYPAGWQQVNVV
ncbi:carbohydrate-binding protein [Youngiibacter multivorans]|uniref:Chitin-binding type-3 domain-containing protein n=1 Tax=Youngiibacter multivorans TaxID=937251 RepID=A0ABS4G8J0_9CLOT|nr:carbohydrate-binding protein [Youngiibacter multivorans]MBP1920849.1 hypothetical protein [Youngiibacter multivorans]